MKRQLFALMTALSFTFPAFAASKTKSLLAIKCHESFGNNERDLTLLGPDFRIGKDYEGDFSAYSPVYSFIDTKINQKTDGIRSNRIGIIPKGERGYRSGSLKVSITKPSAQAIDYLRQNRKFMPDFDLEFDLNKAFEISVAGERGIAIKTREGDYPFSNVLLVKLTYLDAYAGFMTMNGTDYKQTHICKAVY